MITEIMKSSRIKGFLMLTTGLLMIAASVFLTLYNEWDEKQVSIRTSVVLKQLEPLVEEAKIINAIEMEAASAQEETVISDYILNSEMEMPVEAVESNDYIGIITIPAIDIELPVMNNWSNENLKTSPCRYTGSAYTNDLIICAHNYTIHFGKIKNLTVGDSVVFTDMDGNIFRYKVMETEILKSKAIEQMTSGEWDLTLFTCTMDGFSRITVRCGLE